METFNLWFDHNSDPATAFREWRNLKLTESDHMGLSDTPTMAADWVAFRQSLRDLPSNSEYPGGLIESASFVPLDPEGN